MCRAFHQCPFGAPARKPTRVSTTIPGFPPEGPRCNCSYRHSAVMGRRDSQGDYRSQRLANYPPALNEWFASKIVEMFVSWKDAGKGPTGWLPGPVEVKHITNWTSAALHNRQHGICFLNEATARHYRCHVDKNNSAFYLHVDDGVFIAETENKADELMDVSADALARAGFQMTDRKPAEVLDKIIGYDICKQKTCGLRFPKVKASNLRTSMLWLISQEFVYVDVVASATGLWIYGALLRRDVWRQLFTFSSSSRTREACGQNGGRPPETNSGL